MILLKSNKKSNLSESAVQNVCSQMNVALNEAAQILNVSPRSLQRYLRQQETSFSQLREDIRRQSAFKLIVRDDHRPYVSGVLICQRV